MVASLRGAPFFVMVLAASAHATGLGLRVDLRTTSETTIIGGLPVEHRGSSLAAGDLDGDGVADLVVGTRGDTRPLEIDILAGPLAPGLRDMAAGPGEIRIVSTRGSGSASIDGMSATIADLNGDAMPDLAFATPWLGSSRDPSRRQSCVRVFYGPIARGLHDMESRTDLVILASRGSSSETSFLGFDMQAGDLDGDGAVDLLLGELHGDGESPTGAPTSEAGRVHVLFGPLGRGVRDLRTSPADVTILGIDPEDDLGWSVAMGDLSGDGIIDIAASALRADGNFASASADCGEVHVIHGPFARGTWRGLAADPADTVLFGENASPGPGIPGDQIGTALEIADLSGDGRPDLAVGSAFLGGERGQVDVVRGPVPRARAMLRASSTHARIVGAGAGDGLGFDLLADDVNGDGALDLVAGALGAHGGCGPDRPGVAHVFLNPLDPGVLDLASRPSDVAIGGWHDGQDCGYARFTADLDLDGVRELGLACIRTDAGSPPRDQAGSLHLVDVAAAFESATSPCCDAGGPYVLPCTAGLDPCGGLPVLDGTRSSDPLGGSLTWSWSITCGSFGHLASGPTPSACAQPLPGRPCLVRLTVTNARGESSTCATTIELAPDTVAPVLSGMPADMRVPCDAVPAPVPPTATDDCGSATVTLEELREDGPCAHAYELVRTWTATDPTGNESFATQRLEVVDEVAPTLTGVPPSALVACDAVPPPAPVTAEDTCDEEPGLGFVERRIDGPCPGTYGLVRAWTAVDDCGNAVTEEQALDVVDDEPPEVVPGLERVACLWPPSHRMRCFSRETLAPRIRDACSEPVAWRIAECVSDQPDDDVGDGSTSDDCVVAADGDSFCVRAERAGGRPEGRTYAIRIVATDACGNVSTPVGVATVHVPHDSRAGGC